MKKVTHLLDNKGPDVYSIDAGLPVYQALEMMVNKDIGALIVMENGRFKGLITERDYARKVILKGKSSKEISIGEIIEPNIASVTPAHNIEDCMEIMTNKRIRYLPIFAEDKLIGIISIGDIVKFIIDDQKNTIQSLENYIHGAV